jgi:hypothetical protein
MAPLVLSKVVCRQLKAPAGCITQLLSESLCIGNLALAEMPREDQLCVALDANISELIANKRIVKTLSKRSQHGYTILDSILGQVKYSFI